MTCSSCLHGPEVYDVKRWCPHHHEYVTETHPRCQFFISRSFANAEGAYMRPPIDECGVTVTSSGRWKMYDTVNVVGIELIPPEFHMEVQLFDDEEAKRIQREALEKLVEFMKGEGWEVR